MTDALDPRFAVDDVAAGLCHFLDASPSPFHACATAAAMLAEAGFTSVTETDPWPTEPGRYFIIRGGSLIAWVERPEFSAATGFRVVGAHTDSPNLRLKPHASYTSAGWRMLGVEVYGGPLLNSWLDRDLGLSGRVVIDSADGPLEHLLLIDEPILRVSQLAVHLNRAVNTEGLVLNPQAHLAPHFGPGDVPVDLERFLLDRLEITAGSVLGWDLMTHDLTPARRIGLDRDLIAGARTDNLATCHAGVRALLAAADEELDTRPLLVLFDHEEVGSTSDRGAGSTLLPSTIERIVLAAGGTRDDYWRALAGSIVASGDMAHATHPNYVDRHEPHHRIAINGGPVLKINQQLRYATDAPGAAAFKLAGQQAGVPIQEFVVRTDLPCGSTVGPTTAALTGVTTVDFGAPTLSMHSTRELVGTEDQAMYAATLAAFFAPRS